MTIGAGFSSKTAWRREALQSAYGTPSECGAGDQIPLITESLSPEISKEPDNTIRHKAGVGGSEVTGKGVQGSIEIEAIYRGIESLLACALGHALPPTEIATGVWLQNILPAENLHAEDWTAGDGLLAGSGLLAGDKKIRRGTLCIDKNVSIWEHPSTMIQAMTIKGDAKGVRIVLEMIPYKVDRESAVNTSSVAWDIPGTDWLSILFPDLEFWLGDYSTENALTEDNAIGVNAIEIKIQNNTKVERDSLSGLYIAEPRREGKRLVTGSFSVPRYESDALIADTDNQTAKMAMLKFTGSQIGETGQSRTFWIWLPMFKFDKSEAAIAGPSIIPASHTFTAELPAAVPAGFPAAAAKELLLQIQNDFEYHPMIA